MSAFPSDAPPEGPVIVHASCVAWKGRGLLIGGPVGSGKSSLALQLMAFGADLIADDRTALSADRDGPPVAAPVAPIAGLIEARGVGILPADAGAPAASL